MNNFPTIKVAFLFSADLFDLDIITNAMGISPTKTRTKDSFPPSGLPHTEWILKIHEKECWAISIPLEKLFAMLNGKAETIASLSNMYNLKTNIVISIHMDHPNRPELIVPSDIVSFAGAIKAEIGFDLYCYCECE